MRCECFGLSTAKLAFGFGGPKTLKCQRELSFYADHFFRPLTKEEVKEREVESSHSVSAVRSESSALRGTRHWSPGLGKHSRFTTGFQCLRFTMQSRRTVTLRTGMTDRGVRYKEHSPNRSLQCAASLRAQTLEPRTWYAIEIHNWIPVSALQKATHWKDGKGEFSKSVTPVRSESSSADTGAQDSVSH
jgi:hypothetical protein